MGGQLIEQVIRNATKPSPSLLEDALSRKVVFWGIMLSLAVVVPLLCFEILVRLIAPQTELYPRYQYSERFGHRMAESATIVNQLPGVWRFNYRTNEYGYRISRTKLSNSYDRLNVVVLGDSNTFGIGVNDGEEYSAVLGEELAEMANVINLGVGGFGLTNEIRTFYEFGLLFQPAVVVLQFASSDPNDNLYEMVTTVEEGRFSFHLAHSMSDTMGKVKQWLSDSILQRSAAYNLTRNYVYSFWRTQVVEQSLSGVKQDKEAFHNMLLMTFAKDLKRRGIPLILFDVPGDFAMWPGILWEVEAMGRQGLLRHLQTDNWFEGVTDYGTPEGHAWGAKGHRTVAGHLVAPLRTALAESKMVQ
ncbi:MAG: hypothetical protein P0111_07545 [Nitrospira sp.]|nr:hypothetical protein [Nitrospira sp.]